MGERATFNIDKADGMPYLHDLANQLGVPVVLVDWKWMRRQRINVTIEPGKDDEYYELDAYEALHRLGLAGYKEVELVHVTRWKTLHHMTVVLASEFITSNSEAKPEAIEA